MANIKLNMKWAVFFALGIMVGQAVSPGGLHAADDPIPGRGIQILVKETSRVKGPDILLGDVAEIHATPMLKEALEKIVLGASPKPDEIRSVDRRKIVSAVNGQRYLPDDMTLVSPERIYVKRLSQTISKQDIRQFVDETLSRDFKDREYQVTAFSVRGLEPYPLGKIRLQTGSRDMVDKSGRMSFFLDVIIDGTKEDRISVSGTLAVYETVFHSAGSYAKGKILSRETIYREKENIFDLGDDFIKTFEEIDGKILKSSIRKGDYVKLSLLSDPPLVKKGDIIRLVSKNENLMIVTSGISKEDGFENGLIRVENLDSGKLVRGIVKGRSEVEVLQ